MPPLLPGCRPKGYFVRLLSAINQFLWNGPLLLLLLGVHLYFTIRLHVPQRHIGKAIRMSLHPEPPAKLPETASDAVSLSQENILSGPRKNIPLRRMGKVLPRRLGNNLLYPPGKVSPKAHEKTSPGHRVSPFGALATTLAATLGTGNIIGVSTAIALGGPGAVLWCWLTGVLGMATAYAECYLGVLYRQRDSEGHHIGGPMYVIREGLHCKPLACFYALCTVVAAFGVGCTTQANSLTQTTSLTWGLSPIWWVWPPPWSPGWCSSAASAVSAGSVCGWYPCWGFYT